MVDLSTILNSISRSEAEERAQPRPEGRPPPVGHPTPPMGVDVEEGAQPRPSFITQTVPGPRGPEEIKIDLTPLPVESFEEQWVPPGSRFAGAAGISGAFGVPPPVSLIRQLSEPTEEDRFKYQQSVTVRARNAGVDTDNPIEYGQLLASFAFDESEQINAYELMAMRRGKRFYGQRPVMRLGPVTGEVEYYNRDTERYTLAAPTDLSLAAIAGPALATSFEIAGGIGGAFAGNTIAPIAGAIGGGIAGATVGAVVGEFVRLEVGHAMGINKDISWEQYVKRLGLVGGFSIGGNVAATKLMGMLRFVYNGVRGKHMPQEFLGIDPRSEPFQMAKLVQDRINSVLSQARFNSELRFNIAQASGNERLLALQEVFRRSPQFGEEFNKFTQAQRGALQDFWTHINKPYKSGQEITDLNAQLRMSVAEARDSANLTMRESEKLEQLQANPQPSAADRNEIDALLQKQQTAASFRSAEADVVRAYAGLDSFAASRHNFSRDLRAIGTAEQRKFTKWSDDAAAKLGNLMRSGGDASNVQIGRFALMMQRQKMESRNIIIAALRRRHEEFSGPETVTQTVRRDIPLSQTRVQGESTQGVMVVKNTITKLSPNFDPNTRLTFDEAWETLRAIRSAARDRASGATTDGPNVGQLKSLARQLELDIEDMFTRNSGVPGRAVWKTSWDEFHLEYAKGKMLLDEGLMGRILMREGPGYDAAFVMGDEPVADAIWEMGQKGFFENAQQIMALLERNGTDALAFRRALADVYQSRVIHRNLDLGRTEITEAGLRAHDEFMEIFVVPKGGRRSIVEEMGFSKTELAKMTQPGHFRKVVFAKQEAFDNLQKELKKEYGDLIDSENLFNTVWTSADDTVKLRKLLTILNRHDRARQVSGLGPLAKPVIRGLQFQVAKQMEMSILRKSAHPTERVFNAGNLIEYLDGRTALPGVGASTVNKANAPMLEVLFGKQYVKDLRTLAEAVSTTQREFHAPNLSSTAFWSHTMKGVARAYVGLFTRPGRMITAIASIRAHAANKVLMTAMLSPDQLHELVSVQNMNMLSKRAAQVVGQLGGGDLYLYGGPAESPGYLGSAQTEGPTVQRRREVLGR